MIDWALTQTALYQQSDATQINRFSRDLHLDVYNETSVTPNLIAGTINVKPIAFPPTYRTKP